MTFVSSIKKLRLSLIIGLIVSGVGLSSCSNAPDDASFQANEALPSYTQNSFESYIAETRLWLAQNRAFIGPDKRAELELNAPFELLPEHPNGQGILLIHGLGDSPFSFKDIGQDLVKQGFVVRTLLLPGHGSRPADLMLPAFKDWKKAVTHHANLLKAEVDKVWLGGFSTGANLATSHALNDPDIEGLILYSPAFRSNRMDLIRLAKYVSWVWPWADIDPENNMLRYSSLPTHGGALYGESAFDVMENLQKIETYNKPVFMAVSEDDSVIDQGFAIEQFNQKFTHPDSHLVWYGSSTIADQRITRFPTRLAHLNISTGSHMGLLFRRDNPYYGQDGSIKICENGQAPEIENACKNGAEVWYS
ncbi:MAG: alpha/beta fold hydrolase, partial [Alphaproteobacteria bacterium]|nr:alpha/beta fold hydrolase [Alphaproteobacteria bacterium]